MGDITSDYSGAATAVAKRGYIRNEGQFVSGVKRRDFGLLRLEKAIIALTVDGYSTKETAQRIGINEPALGVQLTSIYQKLHVSNQFELILFAVYHQLIDTCDPTLALFRRESTPEEQRLVEESAVNRQSRMDTLHLGLSTSG